MERFRNLSKKEQVIMITFSVVSLLSIMVLFISYNISNITKIQQDYVTEVRDQFKTIAKYDKYNFSKEVYEISKEYPVAVELSENGKVIFSTLDFYIDDINKDDLAMLSKDVISIGDNREIWLGIYDSVDYSGTFNNTFVMAIVYVLIFGMVILTILYLWLNEEHETRVLSESTTDEKKKEKEIDYNIKVDVEEKTFKSFTIADSDATEKFEANRDDEQNTAEESIDVKSDAPLDVEPKKHKYSNFTDKYDYLGGR